MKKYYLILLAILLVLTAGCNLARDPQTLIHEPQTLTAAEITKTDPVTTDPQATPQTTPVDNDNIPPANISFLTDAAFSTTRTISQLSSEFKDAYARISLDLLKKTMEAGKSTIISPISVLTDIGLTTNGARGKTQTTMLEWISPGLSIDALNDQLFSLRERLEKGGESTFVETDGIFLTCREDFKVNAEFLALVKDTYRAQIAQVDFTDQGIIKSLNNWMSDSTNKLIPEVLKSGDVDINTVMLLVNAVCFDAEWEEAFPTSGKSTFHSTSGDKSVKMMMSTEHSFIRGDNETGFIKEYKGGQFGFAALLPREGLSITDYVNGLDGNTFLRLISEQQTNTIVKLALPEFSCETSADLRALLETLGLEEIFSDGADFSGLGHMDDGNGVGLGKAWHRTKLEVCETGTKAGSVSVISATASATEPPGTERLVFDRPFVFSIIELNTGLPVFIGICDL